MIVFYNPPSSANRKPVLPMSLLAMGAVIEGRHRYVIIDGNLEADPVDALDRAITEHGARMLAVTVMPGPQLSDAVPTCRTLRARHPELTIVWGGYFPTQHYDSCLRAPFVDIVVRGVDGTDHGQLRYRRAYRLHVDEVDGRWRVRSSAPLWEATGSPPPGDALDLHERP